MARKKAEGRGANGKEYIDLAFVYKAIGNEAKADECLKRAAVVGRTPIPEEFTFLMEVSSLLQAK